jgi:hypothetical protein
MFILRIDRTFGVCVWYFGGKTNTDDDFERYVASFPLADAIAAAVPFRPVGMVFVETHSPMPNAKWRKRMAEASTTLKSKPCIAFASSSPFFRGVVTAVNWFRPPPYEFTVTSTFEDGAKWLEEKRGVRLPRLFEMFEECRTELHAAQGQSA